MTTYGLDISHYQARLKLSSARDQGYAFCMAKVTEGTTFLDPSYAGFKIAAQAEKLHFAAYHFLRSDSSPAAQAEWCVKNLGDKSIPIMLDVEAEGSSIPNLNHVRQFATMAHSLSARVSLAYIPEWYWRDDLGSPALTGIPTVVASNYVSGSDYASRLYPGDSSSKWHGYGGQNPPILQFSADAVYTGYAGTIDVNAFRGTEDELRALNLFKDYTNMSTLKTHTLNALDGLKVPTLHFGDNDAEFTGYHDVWRLQKMLQITADGVYGPATADAVKAYLGKGDGRTVALADWIVIYGLA